VLLDIGRNALSAILFASFLVGVHFLESVKLVAKDFLGAWQVVGTVGNTLKRCDFIFVTAFLQVYQSRKEYKNLMNYLV